MRHAAKAARPEGRNTAQTDIRDGQETGSVESPRRLLILHCGKNATCALPVVGRMSLWALRVPSAVVAEWRARGQIIWFNWRKCFASSIDPFDNSAFYWRNTLRGAPKL